MSILTEFQFAFQKKEIFYLLFLTILVYLFVLHSSFSFSNIVALVPALVIAYFYYQRTVDKNYSSMHIQNEKLKRIDLDAYPYIQEDIEVVDTLISLEGLFYVNRLQYMEVFKRLNRFYQLYADIKASKGRDMERPVDLYNMAKENSKMAFNAILSFAIQLDSAEERKVLEDTVVQLQRRCQLALNEMESEIQRKWKEGDINIHSQPIYPDEPEPTVSTDVQFSKHYNIY